MTKENRIFKTWGALRTIAINEASNSGVIVRNRPCDLKINEREAILLPHLITEPQSGLSIKDRVFITGKSNDTGPWNLEVQEKAPGIHAGGYFILCFAEAEARKACRIRGVFAILAERTSRSDNVLVGELSRCRSRGKNFGKVYLYWIGDLQPSPFDV